MKMRNSFLLALLPTLLGCNTRQNPQSVSLSQYDNILNIAYTPDTLRRCTGWFSDQGAWMGFTLPEKDRWINGFCGPFDLEHRVWISPALIRTGFAGTARSDAPESFRPDSINYRPGELYFSASSASGTIEQRLIFIDKTNALLECEPSSGLPLCFIIDGMPRGSETHISDNSIIIRLPYDKTLALTFPRDTRIKAAGKGYEAESPVSGKRQAVISFYNHSLEQPAEIRKANAILAKPDDYRQCHDRTWNRYLTRVLRTDMPESYNRIAAKAVVTLIGNWRSSRGGLLHDGVVPSHAVGYFMGFWAWDSWKHAAALASFAPHIAKNQVRAMFDYQLDDGMIIDCIYPDINENNARDSKPPLAAWAVDEIYHATGDTAFVKEIYPQLLSYHRWWYEKRDHDGNGICEFGSTDGTLEAAAWESGMDNAIRFDEAQMVQNGPDAWSFDQESVDLNAFLAYEYKLLKKLAGIAGLPFNEINRTEKVADYFFDRERGFFFDRKPDGSFVRVEGSEAYIPLWSGIASETQIEKMMVLLTDTSKFSTYIPFPTVAADDPKFMPAGYWRGPIWLDQTYFAISGLRRNGYQELADRYTRQVFDRLQGLQAGESIHENYATHTGLPLKAPHFSWSAAHLLMLYREYGH